MSSYCLRSNPRKDIIISTIHKNANSILSGKKNKINKIKVIGDIIESCKIRPSYESKYNVKLFKILSKSYATAIFKICNDWYHYNNSSFNFKPISKQTISFNYDNNSKINLIFQPYNDGENWLKNGACIFHIPKNIKVTKNDIKYFTFEIIRIKNLLIKSFNELMVITNNKFYRNFSKVLPLTFNDILNINQDMHFDSDKKTWIMKFQINPFILSSNHGTWRPYYIAREIDNINDSISEYNKKEIESFIKDGFDVKTAVWNY
jgi:hypothetical protein